MFTHQNEPSYRLIGNMFSFSQKNESCENLVSENGRIGIVSVHFIQCDMTT